MTKSVRNPPVPVSCLEEGIDQLKKFLKNSSGRQTTWGMVVEHEGKLNMYPRDHQPCYGEMRVYEKGEYRPGDLYDPFPPGTPLALGVYWAPTSYVPDVYKALVSDRSPWRSALKDYELYQEDGKVYGFIVKDLNVNSDTLVNFFMIARYQTSWQAKLQKWTKEGVPFDTSVILSTAFNSADLSRLPHSYPFSYIYAISVPQWMSSRPNVPAGHLFSARAAYRRKQIESIWNANKNFVGDLKSIKSGGKFTMDRILKDVVPEIETLRNVGV